jgi:hypothetical protein
MWPLLRSAQFYLMEASAFQEIIAALRLVANQYCQQLINIRFSFPRQ